MSAERPPIFLGGALRSGLLVARALLDSHPNISCGPDLRMTPAFAMQWEELNRTNVEVNAEFTGVEPKSVRNAFAKLLMDVLQERARRHGRCVVADKTPANVIAFKALHALCPEAILVHVVRDGRDVVASLLKRNWVDPAKNAPYPYTRSAVEAARLWVQMVDAGRTAAQAPSLKRRLILIKYEDLVRDPQTALSPLLDRVGEAWDDKMLEFSHRELDLVGLELDSKKEIASPPNARSVGKWRKSLSARQLKEITPLIEPTMTALGYRL
jgi:protein-tyrosine sulfotransferase